MPIAPPAPARFSTITGCPMLSLILPANTRAIASTGPPGEKGVTMVTVRDGYVWASALEASATPSRAHTKDRRQSLTMGSPDLRIGETGIGELRDVVGVDPVGLLDRRAGIEQLVEEKAEVAAQRRQRRGDLAHVRARARAKLHARRAVLAQKLVLAQRGRRIPRL